MSRILSTSLPRNLCALALLSACVTALPTAQPKTLPVIGTWHEATSVSSEAQAAAQAAMRRLPDEQLKRVLRTRQQLAVTTNGATHYQLTLEMHSGKRYIAVVRRLPDAVFHISFVGEMQQA